jgi:hypothetical protein
MVSDPEGMCGMMPLVIWPNSFAVLYNHSYVSSP